MRVSLSRFPNTYPFFGSAIAVGLFVRVLWVALHPHRLIWDEEFYFAMATTLSQGQSLSATIWPVGWPALIAPLFYLFGAHPQVAVWLNVVLSMAVLVGTTRLAYQILGLETARFVVWLMALTPSFILSNVLFMYEVWLQVLLVIIAIYGLRPHQNTRNAHAMLIIGMASGLAGLVRVFWLFLPLCSAALGGLRPASRPTLRSALGAQALAIAVVIPWVLYQSLLMQRFVPVTLNGGMNLWIGNNPAATGTYVDPPANFWNPQENTPATQEALSYIRTHPGRTLALLPAKIWFLFSQEHPVNILFARTTVPISGNTILFVRVLLDGTYYLTMLGALIGTLLLIHERRYVALSLWGWVVFNTLVHLPFFGVARFNWPVRFVPVVYCGYALAVVMPIFIKKYYALRPISAP